MLGILCSECQYLYNIDVVLQNVNTSCPGLLTVKVGSHLGVLIDSAYCLHIYIDGKDQGVVVRYVRQPCYAMFDLYSCLRKVHT